MMRYLAFIIFSFSLSLNVFSQSLNFVGLHGLLDDGVLHFEYQGRTMSVYSTTGKIEDSKTIETIKKNYQLGSITKTYGINKDKVLSDDHIVIESELIDKFGVIIYKTAYLTSNSNSTVEILLFETYNQRNLQLDYSLVKAYYTGVLNQFVHKKRIANTIFLVDKEITLDFSYYWKAPNTVGKGESDELTWSVFSNEEEAQTDSQNRMSRDKNSGWVISLDEYIDVMFNGVPSIARVVTYYPANKKMPFDRYYVVAPINGMFVSCQLTRTLDVTLSRNLPSALKKLISFDDGEGFTGWLTERDVMEIDKRASYKPSKSSSGGGEYDYMPLIDVGLGIWLPTGNLHNIIGSGPSFHIYFSWPPLVGNFTFDFGTGFTYTSKKDRYYSKDVYFNSQYFVPALVRAKYQINFEGQLYLTPYIGGGVHITAVDTENDDYDDVDEFKYPLVGFAGVSLRYKLFAVFMEYNYVNYNWKRYSDHSFGNGSIRTGVAVHF